MPFNRKTALRNEIHLVEIDGSHVDGHVQLHAESASFPAQKEEQKRFFSHRFLRLNNLHILWLNTQ